MKRHSFTLSIPLLLGLAACSDDKTRMEPDDASADPSLLGCDGGVCSADGSAQEGDAGATSRTDAQTPAGDGAAISCVDGGVSCASNAPSAPTLRFANSMAPGSELWTWDKPANTHHFELLLDGGKSGEYPDRSATRFSARLTAGEHTVSVRACTAADECSAYSTGTAKVEDLAGSSASGWRGMVAPITVRTAIGRDVLLICDGCYGKAGAPDVLQAARTALSTAISQSGAKAIRLPVAHVSGKVVVASADAVGFTNPLLLEDVLEIPALAESTALLVLELVEVDNPSELARLLLQVLDARRGVVRNGRPLVVQGKVQSLSHLKQVEEAAAREGAVAPYLRYWLSDDVGDVTGAGLYTAGGKIKPDYQFVHAVTFSFKAPSLFQRIARARAAGLSAIVDGIPGPGHGEIVLASLRDEVDGLSTRYQIAQARGLVTQQDHVSYLSIRESSITNTKVYFDEGGRLSAVQPQLGRSASGTQFPVTAGAPSLVSGIGTIGPALAFRPEHKLVLKPQLETLTPGMLVSLAVRVDEPPAVQNIYGLSYVLHARPSGTQSMLSFLYAGAGARGAYGARLAGNVSTEMAGSPTSPCTASENGLFGGSMELGRAYWIVWAIDRQTRKSRLFVDGRCASEVELRTLSDVSQARDPEPLPNVLGCVGAGDTCSTPGFEGHLYHTQVLNWADPTGHVSN